MLYYSNGGPGPATDLLRVDAPSDHDFSVWRAAKSARWTVRGGWEQFDNAQLDISFTGDYSMVDADEVPGIQAQMRDPQPVEPFDYWNPAALLSLRFVAVLSAIEAGTMTADQIPPESGFNDEVIAALKAVEEWDLSDQWVWYNTPGERGEYPIFQAHLAVAAQCREMEASR